MSATLRERALRGECLADVLIVDWHVHLGRWALSYLPERRRGLGLEPSDESISRPVWVRGSRSVS